MYNNGWSRIGGGRRIRIVDMYASSIDPSDTFSKCARTLPAVGLESDRGDQVAPLLTVSM